MPDERPLVSVVVASFNACDILRSCLQSVVAQDYRPVEIIVIDNGSTEDIASVVRRTSRAANLIRLPENAGFAGGYNTGIRAARGKYLALINNDAVAEPHWLSALVEAAERDPLVGAVASLVIDGNQKRYLDSAGVGIALDGMSRQAMRGVALERFTPPSAVLAPSGCACLYRAAALAETGLFDEDFFAYCEDTDLGLRLRWAGWKAVLAADARVVHYYSATVGSSSLKKLFWVERNHYWVAAKDFPLSLLWAVPLVTAWRFILQAWLMLVREPALTGFSRESGFASVAAAILKAHLAAAAGLPNMLRKRAEFRPHRKLAGREMAEIILSGLLPMKTILSGRQYARK